MDVNTGKVRELTDAEKVKTAQELLKKGLVPIPGEYAGAFHKRGPGMKNAATRIAAAKSARRKARRAARKSQKRNRR